MAVAGHTRRSVVSTASYEARKYGVSSGMSIQEAIRLCPDLIIQEGHYHYYEELSSQFIAIVSLYSARVEQASIDECYVDMTETIRRYERPLDLAWELPQRNRSAVFHRNRTKSVSCQNGQRYEKADGYYCTAHS